MTKNEKITAALLFIITTGAIAWGVFSYISTQPAGEKDYFEAIQLGVIIYIILGAIFLVRARNYEKMPKGLAIIGTIVFIIWLVSKIYP